MTAIQSEDNLPRGDGYMLCISEICSAVGSVCRADRQHIPRDGAQTCEIINLKG